MSSIKYENQIIDAIETIVDNAVKNANYDKTIKATIVEQTNKNIGEYKVKYQDSTFFAYAADTTVQYTKDILVYVLIPNNDMEQIKTIISAVDKNNVEYIEVLEEEDYFDEVGTNVFNSNEEFKLCSYSPSEITLYDKEKNINIINYDEKAFNLYFANLYNFICGGYFKTKLDYEQRRKGNYGICFEMETTDDIDKEKINIKNFVIDVNNIEGNPYNLINYSKQTKIFELDFDYFKSIKRIYLFSKGFPIEEDGHDYDIFFKTPVLYGAREIPEAELNGYSVSLSTNKNYFNAEDEESAELDINSIVKIRGKEVGSERKIEYYWFKENAEIYPTMITFNSYGGAGWECLNEYNVINSETNEIEYITDKSSLKVLKSNCKVEDNNYKLVVVFNENTTQEKTINIKNYDAAYSLSIVSDEGIVFYYGNGTPTLTVLINEKEDVNNFTYKWVKIDENNLYENLEETTEDNNNYNTLVNNYNTLLNSIETGQTMPAAAQEQLEKYADSIDSYNYKQRVEKNKIHKIQVSEIKEYNIYKCSIYDELNLVGTVSITISNYPEIKGEYYLNIVGGIQTFNYNGMGIAPNSLALENPIELKPLSFEIIDGKGNNFPQRILEVCKVKWKFPKENSLIIGEDTSDLICYYDLEQNYDINKINNNNIELEVEYQELKLRAQTNFTFIKDGDPGTNGTDIVCKIVPNTEENFSDYPIIICNLDGSFKRLNFTPVQESNWFKVQLWQNGTIVWEGVTKQTSEGVSKLVWSNLFSSPKEKSHIQIYSGGLCSYANIDNSLDVNQFASDIIQVEVEYKNVTYYSTIPITVVKIKDDNYFIENEKNKGYRFVSYSSDGKTPQYENRYPFTLKVTQNINGYKEDITETKNSNYQLSYIWETQGSIYRNTWILENNLLEDFTINQYGSYLPVDSFSGECTNNAIQAMVFQNGEEVAEIHIPIHFYLNRYGISALNGWNGNSISIDNDNGIILSPQVGAGSKNEANQFTGILMGSVREGSTMNLEEGLFGYHEGVRTIFLDAHSGKTELGKNGKGRIIIDPSIDNAQIYSGNYSVENKTGLLIDLTIPEIKFGSGNFSVNSFGHLVAKGGGSIGGWQIGDVELYSGEMEQYVRLDSGTDNKVPGADDYYTFWAGNEDPTKAPVAITRKGKLIAAGVDINGAMDSDNMTITGGTMIIGDKFSVNKDGDGILRASGAVVSGVLTAEEGSIIGPFDVSEIALYNTKESAEDSNNGVYLGIDAISLGANNVFKVDNLGNAIAKNISISGGNLAGWNVNTENIFKGNGNKYFSLNSNDSLEDNIALWAGNESKENAPLQITYSGLLKSESSILNNSSINSSSLSDSSIINSSAENIVLMNGQIGDNDNTFTFGEGTTKHSAIKFNKTNINDNNEGIYLGTDGIYLGTEVYYTKIFPNGVLESSNVSLTGGSISWGNTTIDNLGTFMSSDSNITGGSLFFGNEDITFLSVSNSSQLLATTAELINPTIKNGNISYTFSSSEARINEIPRIYSGTNAPSGGKNGDIYVQYS